VLVVTVTAKANAKANGSMIQVVCTLLWFLLLFGVPLALSYAPSQ
jgi:hypothetical protein